MPCSTRLAWICHTLSNLEDSKLATKPWCDRLLELFCFLLVGGFPAAMNDSNTRGILATNVNVGATSIVQKYLDCMHSLLSIPHTQEICANLFHQIAEFVYDPKSSAPWSTTLRLHKTCSLKGLNSNFCLRSKALSHLLQWHKLPNQDSQSKGWHRCEHQMV